MAQVFCRLVQAGVVAPDFCEHYPAGALAQVFCSVDREVPFDHGFCWVVPVAFVVRVGVAAVEPVVFVVPDPVAVLAVSIVAAGYISDCTSSVSTIRTFPKWSFSM